MLNTTGHHIGPGVKRRWRILCADDHTMIGMLLVRMFSLAGYEVEHVPDGRAAWQRASADLRHFDVIITDHHMPEMTGLELASELVRAKFPGRIIVHSANLPEEVKGAYRRLGVQDIIAKQPHSDELLATVEALHRASLYN